MTANHLQGGFHTGYLECGRAFFNAPAEQIAGLALAGIVPQNGRMTTRKPITLHKLREMYAAGEKITMLTCYDAVFAHLLDESGVDVLLVGDSLGMVLQGRPTTLGVTIDDMVYHTGNVARGNRTAWIMADLPFGSYQESPEQALRSAARLMQAGAQMVKLEGGLWVAPTLSFLAARGIPVCAHIGFTPQFVHSLGGFRVQGRNEAAAAALIADARKLAESGADFVLMEMVPAAVARAVTASVAVPTIGIGAGAGCSGQVLVLHDMLGITFGSTPRFVRDFAAGAAGVGDAVRRYVADVKGGAFPDDSLHSY